MQNNIHWIDRAQLTGKTVLVRVDYNVSLNPDHTIGNDVRIRQSLPTLEYLLKEQNKIILLSHLGRPKTRDAALSLKPILKDLKHYLPEKKIAFVEELEQLTPNLVAENDITLLENIRFYEEEDTNDPVFAQKLASLADVFVNDAFSVSHRATASTVGITHYLPSYGGLLLKKEVEMLSSLLEHPKKPFVAILGGAKIETKLKLIKKLVQIADTVLLGGGLANTLLLAQGNAVGESLVEKDEVEEAKKLLSWAKTHHTTLLLPVDAVVGTARDSQQAQTKLVQEISENDMLLDIGPETEALFGTAIATAQTLLWNGPVGYFENPLFARGTDFLYYAIADAPHATSIVGGGETLAALTKKEHLERISHISTGGGAMLEFIENGTLPAIEALKTHGA